MLSAQDKNIRDMGREQVELLYKVIGGMQHRTLGKESSMKDLEIFKLEMCKK